MKNILLGKSGLSVPNIGIGCMRMAALDEKATAEVITTAMEVGMNFFDHADIYGGGRSEEIFAQGMKLAGINREDIMLQSKCGIRKGEYNFTSQHILSSVDGILQRLETDYLDVLVLHRPDTLFEPEEVAETFTKLQQAGKVKHFGVSNQNSAQIALLQKYMKQKLVTNQLQFSIMHTGMIDAGINVNMAIPKGADQDGHILEYCRMEDITIQTWSPFQYGFFEGTFLDNDKFPELNEVLNRLAKQYDVTNTAIAAAWILRHPAQMQVIAGSMNPARIRDIAKASSLTLSHEEWYEIYRVAGNQLP